MDSGALRARCGLCRRESPLIASSLGFCATCLREHPTATRIALAQKHAEVRAEFGLPLEPPRDPEGVLCSLCANECRIGRSERGFCGLRENRRGRLAHLAGTPRKGLLHWYRDPVPTNCVADWVCEGHHQRGRHNLAVFYGSCTFDCLFCQNWHYRDMDPGNPGISAQELADAADPDTFCACYFGGDPASQMPHALAASRLPAGRGVRICWETNGSMHPKLLDRAVELSLRTGGCMKFDLKTHDEGLHRALTGAGNRRTWENFARAATRAGERPDPPLIVASTLLVPGYIDTEEVGRIASFIAELDPDIPYSLLGFHPNFYIHDLPRTSVRHAESAEAVARAAGLTRVHIGNRHLLGHDY